MAQAVGDLFWERMHEWGVRIVFEYPGDGVNGLLGAMRSVGDRRQFGARRGGWCLLLCTLPRLLGGRPWAKLDHDPRSLDAERFHTHD
jgi:hypothetical protein